MLFKITKKILVFTVIAGLFFSIKILPIRVSSATEESASFTETKKGGFGLDATAESASLDTKNNTNVSVTIGKVIGIALSFVGTLFFILMIYGGFLWMTARGEAEQVTKAKDLIIDAIIGLVIVLSAYAITAFVGGSLTGQ